MFIYINDIFLLSSDMKTINNLKYKFNDIYKMTNCELCKHYLNMTIKQDQQLRILTVFQKTYFEKVLDHFEFSNLRLTITLMKQDLKLKIFEKQINIIFIE